MKLELVVTRHTVKLGDERRMKDTLKSLVLMGWLLFVNLVYYWNLAKLALPRLAPFLPQLR